MSTRTSIVGSYLSNRWFFYIHGKFPIRMEVNREEVMKNRRFSDGKSKSMSMSPENVKENNASESSANSNGANPSPIKFPPRNISDVESRLLNLAKEKPVYRRRRDDSSSDNESSDRYKRKTKSPDRKSSRSPRSRRSLTPVKRSHSKDKQKSKSPYRRSRSPKKRSPIRRKDSESKASPNRRSPSPRKRKGRSRSPRGSKSRINPRSRSPHHRRRSRSRSVERRRRSRSRSVDKRRRTRSRSRSRDRKRSPRGKTRDYNRSRGKRYSHSRSPSPMFTSKWGQKPAGICRAVLPANPDDKRSRQVTTEDVEKRLAQHMQSVQQKAAEEAKKINLPGYLNPAMVNVHQFKQVQDKRKLLWSKAKDKTESASAQWSGAFGDQNNDEKFRRLMGIQETSADGSSEKIQESRKVLDDLEKEYEKSRAFQLSRGAGGLTGIGLGFGSAMQPQ